MLTSISTSSASFTPDSIGARMTSAGEFCYVMEGSGGSGGAGRSFALPSCSLARERERCRRWAGADQGAEEEIGAPAARAGQRGRRRHGRVEACGGGERGRRWRCREQGATPGGGAQPRAAGGDGVGGRRIRRRRPRGGGGGGRGSAAQGRGSVLGPATAGGGRQQRRGEAGTAG
ncbi:hypothetical protein DAI22_03g254900 [Oryza sativa Japonica Group]|nr:hypothetical protein DAI22_03g254900 [Oryza sativa Japonica Group]